VKKTKVYTDPVDKAICDQFARWGIELKPWELTKKEYDAAMRARRRMMR
jgi:hypothetical protein